jgi:T4 superinfection immunity protein
LLAALLALIDARLSLENVAVLRVLVLTSVALPFYFLPAILGRQKPSALAIFVLDLLLGWTVIGWIVALIWAVTGESQQRASVLEASPACSALRLCHMCLKASGPDTMFCIHCGTAFVPEELRTTFSPRPAPLIPLISITDRDALTRQASEGKRKSA